VDINESRAREFADKNQCGYFTDDYKKLLAEREVDYVTICTPNGLREPIVDHFARAKKHVIVEKPVEILTDRIDRMISVCRANGVKLACIYNTRYEDSHFFLKEAVEKKRFGRLINGNAYIRWYRTPEYYKASSWRGTWEYGGGGALMTQGIHTVDLLQWYMGDVESVFAYCGTLCHKKIEVEDTVTVTLRFKNGALGVIVGATSIYPGFPSKLEITGVNGTAEVTDGRIETWSFRDSDPIDTHAEAFMREGPAGNRAADPMDFSYENHKRQIHEIVRDIENGQEPMVNGEEARKAVRLILAIYESCKTGKEVRIMEEMRK